MILALYLKFPFILDRNLAKANCTENQVCTSCDTVVLGLWIYKTYSVILFLYTNMFFITLKLLIVYLYTAECQLFH